MGAILRRLRGWAMHLIGAIEGVDGCCGCGQPVINVALVDDVRGQEVPGETYCWECWHDRPVLSECDHIELTRPLVNAHWRETDRGVRALIAERAALRDAPDDRYDDTEA